MSGEKRFYKQNTLPSFEEIEGISPPHPEKIGPYKIEALLNKGGMSLLYLGIDPKTKDPLVVKVLSPQYVNHPEMADHFLWEAKIISLADHPNIVKLYEYGKWDEGLYIAMEFIRGVSLRQFLMQQSFSLKRSLDIILQVSFALLHLHSHGVVHRDLKPENIIISEDGEVKVIDFGIAQLHEEKSKLGQKMIGTPSYMSPEQKENPQNVTFASDIYALGIITYELILGKISYGMINLSLLPAGLQPIVGKAIAVSPSERYKDIVEFINDLTDYFKSPAIEKERPSTDVALEWRELLQKADQNLSVFEKPKWPQVDIGIAKDFAHEDLGFYLDFFKFVNNTMCIILAHTTSNRIASTAHVAVLRGMIRALLQPQLTTTAAFSPSGFASNLNTLLCQDRLKDTFSLTILKLIPLKDSFLYLCCGEESPLFHVPQGKNSPRIIHNSNPYLGEDLGATFAETEDTFNDGDTLVLQNLPRESFEQTLFKGIERNVLLSPSRLSETLLKEASGIKEYTMQSHPKAILSLQRIA